MKKIFRNFEIKSILIVMLGILVVLLVTLNLVNRSNITYLNSKLIDQNAAILNQLIQIEGVEAQDVVDKFYNDINEKDIEEGRKILLEYSYDESLSLEKNTFITDYNKVASIKISVITIIILLIGFFIIIAVLWNLYSKLRHIANKSDDLVNGNYINIREELKEGEIAILIKSLNMMAERVNNSVLLLEEEKGNLKDYLSDISHQLKTPLASLIMLNELMIEDEGITFEKRKIFLEKSKEQLERMEWLILNLLKMGRLEANVIQYNMTENNLLETLNLAVSPLREIINNKSQKILIKCDENLEFIYDREWLAEAITNIVKNAVEHTDIHGEIFIEAIEGKLSTKIVIRDTGQGMESKVCKDIFKRFFKGDKNSDPKSIGIGLYLSKNIIEGQNGDIKVFSEIGRGTEFIITFIK